MMIPFAAEPIFTIWQLPFTNTLLTSLLSSIVLITLAFILSQRLTLMPNRFQTVIETLIEGLYKVNVGVSEKRTALIFPWFATFFLFIIISNWMGLLPGFGSIGFYTTHEGKEMFLPLLRPANTDLNMTLGLALVSLAATHILSVKVLGAKEYVSRFISLNPVNLFIGILEIVAEFTKIASLSLRLFGNIFAGEAILTTTTSFLAFVAPIPFLVLETVVGLVQALIFAMLTMVFMTILTTPHGYAKEGVRS